MQEPRSQEISASRVAVAGIQCGRFRGGCKGRRVVGSGVTRPKDQHEMLTFTLVKSQMNGGWL